MRKPVDQGKPGTKPGRRSAAHKASSPSPADPSAGQAREQMLEDIIEFLPDAMFAVDEGKRVIAWNLACEIMTGVKKEDVLGQGDHAYAVPFAGERRPLLIDLLDTSVPEVEIMYKYVQRDGDTIYGESFMPLLRGGRGAHLWGSAAPLFDSKGRRCGAIEVIRDVTLQKIFQKALNENELKFRTLFETANDAILLIRGDSILDCNPRTLTMFAGERSRIVGSPMYALSPPSQPDGRNSREASNKVIDRALAEGTCSFEWLHSRLDGSTFSTEVSLNRLDLGGEVLVQAIIRDVTERKRAEEEARISSLHLSYLTKYANDLIILLDEDYRFIEINERVVDAYGYSRDELIGMHATELRAENTKALFNDQRRSDPTTGRAVYETIHRRKNGTTFPVEISMREIDIEGKKFYQAIIRDITVQKLAEKALRDSERKYRELVENANSIILHWTPDGRVIFMNEFGQRFFGYSNEELRGRNVLGTIVPEMDGSNRDLTLLMEEIGKGPAAYELNVNENMRRNGERVWVAWTNKAVLDAGGRVTEILSIGSDITERKRAEDELRAVKAGLELRVAERTAELVVARDRAEESDRLKSAFLATMSHELRTPLNSVIGFTGLLLQGLAGPLNEEQAKQLMMVRGSGQHLLALINEVLDISKIEAGQVEIHNEPFDLSESILQVVQTVTPQADKKGLRIETDGAAGLGLIVGDRRRIEQIMLNLLSNAIKFTKSGDVRVAGRREGGRMIIRVTDSGIGIKPEDLGTLFRPFRQIDSGLTRQFEGTGLGLAICKRLAERMGGDISAESRWGEGSTFQVILPLEPEGSS